MGARVHGRPRLGQGQEEIQIQIWKQISHLLSDLELSYIMEGDRKGKDLMDLHVELDVFTKYQVDMLKVIEIIRRRYPEQVLF